jgi:hypothetical protein
MEHALVHRRTAVGFGGKTCFELRVELTSNPFQHFVILRMRRVANRLQELFIFFGAGVANAACERVGIRAASRAFPQRKFFTLVFQDEVKNNPPCGECSESKSKIISHFPDFNAAEVNKWLAPRRRGA